MTDHVNVVDFLGMQLDPGTGGVAVILRERKAPGRVVPIVIGGAEAVSIAMALSDDEPGRRVNLGSSRRPAAALPVTPIA